MGAQLTRVLVVLTDLEGGGAQRVMVSLLRQLPRDRFEPHLACVRLAGPLSAEIPPDVPSYDFGAQRVRAAARPLVRLARSLRPHVIVSTLYHLNQFLLLMRPLLPRRTRLVIREAINVSEAFEHRSRWHPRTFLLPYVYPTADRIVCQSQSMARDLERNFRVPPELITTIYNPVDREALRLRAREGPNPFAGKPPGPHLVAIGRLAPQKGFDLLIRALPALRELRPDARLWILGDESGAGGKGRTQSELLSLARTLGVADCVSFEGFVPNPWAYLLHADLFVLSSRYEGLPNALLEAIALGCPVLALDRPGGTAEIMELTGQSRRLVPELVWRPDWFRGAAPDEPADLSKFEVERAVAAYAELLAPGL